MDLHNMHASTSFSQLSATFTAIRRESSSLTRLKINDASDDEKSFLESVSTSPLRFLSPSSSGGSISPGSPLRRSSSQKSELGRESIDEEALEVATFDVNKNGRVNSASVGDDRPQFTLTTPDLSQKSFVLPSLNDIAKQPSGVNYNSEINKTANESSSDVETVNSASEMHKINIASIDTNAETHAKVMGTNNTTSDLTVQSKEGIATCIEPPALLTNVQRPSLTKFRLRLPDMSQLHNVLNISKYLGFGKSSKPSEDNKDKENTVEEPDSRTDNEFTVEDTIKVVASKKSNFTADHLHCLSLEDKKITVGIEHEKHQLIESQVKENGDIDTSCQIKGFSKSVENKEQEHSKADGTKCDSVNSKSILKCPFSSFIFEQDTEENNDADKCPLTFVNSHSNHVKRTVEHGENDDKLKPHCCVAVAERNNAEFECETCKSINNQSSFQSHGKSKSFPGMVDIKGTNKRNSDSSCSMSESHSSLDNGDIVQNEEIKSVKGKNALGTEIRSSNGNQTTYKAFEYKANSKCFEIEKLKNIVFEKYKGGKPKPRRAWASDGSVQNGYLDRTEDVNENEKLVNRQTDSLENSLNGSQENVSVKFGLTEEELE